jgi:cobalt transporter subunit CbtB
MISTANTSSIKKNTFKLSSSLQLTAALGIGLGLFLFIAFAPIEAVHNATHDARHAFAFPCH